MVSRIYVEKRAGFDVEAQQLKSELTEILGVTGLTGLRLINRYDVEGMESWLSKVFLIFFKALVQPYFPLSYTAPKCI